LPTNAAGKSVNKSRETAYSLLNELIKRSPIIMTNFIEDQLKPLLEMIKKPKGWNYNPPNSSERVQKYVGLKNLGCICYMNSMMQQFFMIPAFRYNMLCVDDGLPEDNKEYKHETIDDNMLHQMQRLFAHLELSERMDYNPIGFTFSFKEFDGAPTNTSEQKDAQEFLNIWADRVENALKPTSRKYLLQSVFGGKTCSQLICPECGKVKNRLEDQLNLSLTVKDLQSVNDSLEQLVKGEVISDFNCDGCNKKVDITKRTLIAETPNVLIVHLQRILFDFDTCQNEKLNQYFEFPALLDLKPYSYHEVMRREHRV
jgi:ubiquitin carboxyl-terminal hydrolase 34